MTTKRICCNWRCAWKGDVSETLTGPHPFIPGETVQGCPKCRDIDTLRVACDEPGCWEEGTCGTPVKHGESKGYRTTCGKHMPKDETFA